MLGVAYKSELILKTKLCMTWKGSVNSYISSLILCNAANMALINFCFSFWNEIFVIYIYITNNIHHRYDEKKNLQIYKIGNEFTGTNFRTLKELTSES